MPQDEILAPFQSGRHNHGTCVAGALKAAEEICRERGLRLTPLRRRILEMIWNGHEPVGAYHLLDKCDVPSFNRGYRVVELRRVFALPIDFVRDYATNAGQRLRLMPPYREQLSQSFARFFMRVGLPVDIDRDAFKPAKTYLGPFHGAYCHFLRSLELD